MAAKVRPAAKSVRISPLGSERLTKLAQTTGKSKVELLDTAIAKLDEELFWQACNAGYLAHAEELSAEYELAEGANMDGFEDIPV